MPLPKRQKAPTPRKTSSDSRFAAFETDPKFRLPSKKHAKTKLDARFSRLTTDADFYSKASVDKYGRPISKEQGKKDFQRMYELGDDDEDDDEEDEDEDDVESLQEHKSDRAVQRKISTLKQRGIDPIRDGGLSSSSDESSDDEEENFEEEEVQDQTELAGDGNEVPMGDVTTRLAAVNLDWDNIRAADIFAVATSFLPADGRIKDVTIYPSEFGLERLQREEIEGPPREIFSAMKNQQARDIADADDLQEESSENEESVKGDTPNDVAQEEFDSKALRTYQLDRLRYYYAVITCSTENAAKAIYDNLDGREYLSSANFFDLRFVPDEVDFDADPHDTCTKLPSGYKPNEFVTDALSHSKVKLTWDADDTARQEVQKRAFSRKEIDENELQAYIGSEASSSESEDDKEETAKADKVASMRAALGLDASGKSSKPKSSSKRDRDFKKPDGEMEVTFTSGLSAKGNKGAVFENEPEENTLEKYKRQQKERKAKRLAKAKARREGLDPDAVAVPQESPATAEPGQDPFNDPFFDSDPEAEKAMQIQNRKEQRAKKREERERQEKESAAERANLQLLMADDEQGKVQHFDMNEIMKAEKASKKKGKKNKKAAENLPMDDFKINTNDPRFAKLFENPDFAIDPTNSRFKETSGMKALLEEGRKKRKHDRDDEHEPKKARPNPTEGADDLKKLAARVKAKTKR